MIFCVAMPELENIDELLTLNFFDWNRMDPTEAIFRRSRRMGTSFCPDW
jgi:hypothetical protein